MKIFQSKNIIYLLFAYLIAQFIWWEILLVQLNSQNIEKEKQLAALNSTDISTFQKKEQVLNKQLFLKNLMIVGEGSVFLILIIYGFYRVLKAYSKEIVVSERQTHFLLSLPHEIKTPLSIVQLNLQTILQKNNLSDEQKKSLITTSLNELKRLQILVEHLLLTNKITKDKYQLNIESLNLSQLVNEWLITYESQKNIEKKIQDNLIIQADQYLVYLMFQNLLSNAVKFAEQEIKVYLFSKDEKIFLEIWNDGDLIRDDEKDKIFELFYRRKQDEDKGIKGTGLGLYLVKQILQLHHFSIRVMTKNNYNVFQIEF